MENGGIPDIIRPPGIPLKPKFELRIGIKIHHLTTASPSPLNGVGRTAIRQIVPPRHNHLRLLNQKVVATHICRRILLAYYHSLIGYGQQLIIRLCILATKAIAEIGIRLDSHQHHILIATLEMGDLGSRRQIEPPRHTAQETTHPTGIEQMQQFAQLAIGLATIGATSGEGHRTTAKIWIKLLFHIQCVRLEWGERMRYSTTNIVVMARILQHFE